MGPGVRPGRGRRGLVAAPAAITRFLGAFLATLADALLPLSCACCRTPLSNRPTDMIGLCAACREGMTLVAPPMCVRCGQPALHGDDHHECPRCTAHPPPFRRLRGVFAYGGTARDLVLRFKHGKAFTLARSMGTLLAAVAAREGLVAGADVVIPVPAWAARTVDRRYSPPALLAVEVGRRTGIPVETRSMLRVRAPSADRHAGPRARAERIAGAFEVRKTSAIRGKAVLVVDDVVASGATAMEIASVLLAAGASRVDFLALALATPDTV